MWRFPVFFALYGLMAHGGRVQIRYLGLCVLCDRQRAEPYLNARQREGNLLKEKLGFTNSILKLIKEEDTIQVMGYPVFKGDLGGVDWPVEKMVVNTINQYSYCIAEEDPEFKAALRRSDILLPDGVGITLASQWLNGIKINKIAGADIHEYLLRYLQETGGRCFYMGSSEQVLAKIVERIKKEYPKVRVATYSPPYKTTFSAEENTAIINAINAFSPDVVFVGMDGPQAGKMGGPKPRPDP